MTVGAADKLSHLFLRTLSRTVGRSLDFVMIRLIIILNKVCATDLYRVSRIIVKTTMNLQ